MGDIGSLRWALQHLRGDAHKDEVETLRAENIRLRAQNAFLWRRLNPATMRQEDARYLGEEAAKAHIEWDTFVLMCGCKVFRDGSRVMCNACSKETK